MQALTKTREEYNLPYRAEKHDEGISRQANDFKTIVIYSTLGLGTATGLFFLARHFYLKTRVNRVAKDTLEEGSPAAYASQLKMAFYNDNSFGWGTDEEQVFTVFTMIPSKSMYSKVQNAYHALYNRNLNTDLESELTNEEYNRVIRIINAKKN